MGILYFNAMLNYELHLAPENDVWTHEKWEVPLSLVGMNLRKPLKTPS